MEHNINEDLLLRFFFSTFLRFMSRCFHVHSRTLQLVSPPDKVNLEQPQIAPAKSQCIIGRCNSRRMLAIIVPHLSCDSVVLTSLWRSNGHQGAGSHCLVDFYQSWRIARDIRLLDWLQFTDEPLGGRSVKFTGYWTESWCQVWVLL